MGLLDVGLTMVHRLELVLSDNALNALWGAAARVKEAFTATLDELVFYAADAKAPPHQGKRGKAEREAETGFAGTLLGGGAPAPSK